MNRFYLLAYTLISFLVPFIDISTFLERNKISENTIVRFIPSVNEFGNAVNNLPVKVTTATSLFVWDWIIVVFAVGSIVLIIRLFVQLLSFKKIISKARLISDQGVKLYQVNQSIIPFSFGKSIFINHELHTEDELVEIVRHEFVHVRQLHTIDIIWSEIFCIINWYNPAAWLIRKSIRQNLEFIADHKVLQSGIDKKQYQYLLLKVIGNNHFSIAQNFNFSSLKKRIAMMNKMKSARTHLVKFLFILPLMAILVIAFRNKDNEELSSKTVSTSPGKKQIVKEDDPLFEKINDTIPNEGTINSKGYFVDITGDKGNCIVIVKDKSRKEVKRILLTDWNKKSNYYNSLYGALPVEPKDSPVEVVSDDKKPVVYEVEDDTVNKELKKLELNDDLLATITFNNGKIEKYDLNKEADKKVFEKKYGPVISALPKGQRPVQIIKIAKAGTASEAAIVSPSSPTKESTDIYVATTQGSPAVVETIDEFVEPAAPVKSFDNVTGDVVLDIKGSMAESKVREMVIELKNKGYDLIIEKLEYRNEKISFFKGSISGNGKKQNFEASDFFRFTISDLRKGSGKSDFNFYIGSGSLVWQ